MARRRHTPEQVINKLREAEVARAEGSTVARPPAASELLSRPSTGGVPSTEA